MYISYLIHVYNEEKNIEELYRQLIDKTKAIGGIDRYEIIFINDGSRDRSYEIIKNLAKDDKNVKCINFSRNFGQQVAIMAGIEHCEGDAAIIMDADLQDDPSLINKLLDKYNEGFDVVYAVREKRKESFFKRRCFALFHKVMNRVSDIAIPENAGSFSLLNRRTLAEIKKMQENNFYIPGLRAYVGFRSAGVTIERAERHAGESKSFFQLVGLAKKAIFSFSFFPLELMFFIGIISLIVSFTLAVYVVYEKIFYDIVSGWASLLIVIIFFNAMQFLCFAVLGEYLAIIFDETKKRQRYIVEEKINFDQK